MFTDLKFSGTGRFPKITPSTDPLLGLYILVLQGHRYKHDNEGQSLSDSGMLRFGFSVLKN